MGRRGRFTYWYYRWRRLRAFFFFSRSFFACFLGFLMPVDAGTRRVGGEEVSVSVPNGAPLEATEKRVRPRNSKTLQPRKADARDDAAGSPGGASHAARRRDAIECAAPFTKTSRRIQGRSRRARRRNRAVVGRSRLKCLSTRVFRDGVNTARFAGIYAARRAGAGATRTVAVVLVRLVVSRMVGRLSHTSVLDALG